MLSEKKEEELEKVYEGLDLNEDRFQQPIGSGADLAEENGNGVQQQEFNESATRATTESMKSGELLAEALTVWKQEKADFLKYEMLKTNNPEVAPPTRNPFAIQMNANELPCEECVLIVVNQIRSSHLNEALLTLPFGQVTSLIECVCDWISRVNRDKLIL